jgi:tripartite-type tricarboxylate transporter receptor subunit TctC
MVLRTIAQQALWCAASMTLLVAGSLGAAEIYPSKPVRLIVPFPPGGSNDVVARVVAAQLSERLGQQVAVDNRGGAGAVIGTELAARADPDGYTLLFVSTSFAADRSLYKLPYDPARAFTPVAMVASGSNVLVVTPDLPVHSVQELIALARAKPGTLNWASAGVGSFQHLSGELFRSMAGIDIVHVPFKGGGPAMVDVMAGNTQIMLSSLVQTLPQIRSGKLRAVAVGSARRSSLLPDVPTLSEAGLPGYEATNWWGIVAPAGTPAPIVDKLYEDIARILASTETEKRFRAEAIEPFDLGPAEFGRYIATEAAKWARVIKEANIKPE